MSNKLKCSFVKQAIRILLMYSVAVLYVMTIFATLVWESPSPKAPAELIVATSEFWLPSYIWSPTWNRVVFCPPKVSSIPYLDEAMPPSKFIWFSYSVMFYNFTNTGLSLAYTWMYITCPKKVLLAINFSFCKLLCLLFQQGLLVVIDRRSRKEIMWLQNHS